MRSIGVAGLTLVACTAPSEGADAFVPVDAFVAVDAFAPVDAGPAGCAASLDPGICSGAVDPTTLGTGIDAVEVGLGGGDPGLAWFCAPAPGVAWNDRLVIYLVGTYGDPVEEHLFAREACRLGFVAIAPMYENRDMSRPVCGDDGPCYGHYHEEILDGGDVAPDPVDVSPESSIRNRITTLVAHLATSPSPETSAVPWTTARDRLAADDWSHVVLAGHSQGAGHVGHLARDVAAERVVMLSSPADRVASGTPANAAPPWITVLDTTPMRTTLRFGMIHDDDSFEIVSQVVDNWDHMGVPDGTCAHRDDGAYAASCRRIRAASEGCTGIAAHLTPTLASWGGRCSGTGATHLNAATWAYLLTAAG